MGEKMKKISFLLLGALITCPVIAQDYDDLATYDDESYTTTSEKSSRDTYAGIRIHRNSNIAFNFEPVGANHITLRNDNFGFGLNIGNRLTDNVKLEFETMYTITSESKESTKFDYTVWSNMLNMYLYKNYGGAVEPYVGIGVGFGGIWADIESPFIGDSSNSYFDMSFDLLTGVNFSLNEYIDLNFGFRYVNYGKVKTRKSTTHVDATEIYIGAAYKFSIFNK